MSRAKRQSSGQRGRVAGLVGVRRVLVHGNRLVSVHRGTEGASQWVWREEGWFERSASHLCEAKNHLDQSHFSVAASTNRPQIEARGGIAASSAGSCAMGSQGSRREKKSEEGHSSAFFTQKEMRPLPPCVFGGSQTFRRAKPSALYIGNK